MSMPDTFSWIDCNYNQPILNNVNRTCYLLIPKEFVNQYDCKYGMIAEECYEGDCTFGGYSAFELVLDWNKDILKEEMIDKPIYEEIEGLNAFEIYELKRNNHTEEDIKRIDEKRKDFSYKYKTKKYREQIQQLHDFLNGIPDTEMREKYGMFWKERLGYAIAGTNEKKEKLKYPIKVTYDNSSEYECSDFSKVDPFCGMDEYVFNEMYGYCH